jgi:hypothetical protein
MASITFRSDDLTDRALAELTADGAEKSEAIRQALLAAAKLRRQARLRAESLKLAANPAYRAEVAAVQKDMEELIGLPDVLGL